MTDIKLNLIRKNEKGDSNWSKWKNWENSYQKAERFI
jgi:hypothetical protein